MTGWDAGPGPAARYDIALPPVSTAEYARLRPERLVGGRVPDHYEIVIGIGPSQLVGDTVWIATRFYDGEGSTGVGAFGFADSVARQVTMVYAPAIADWSISALLVEPYAVWLGLVFYGEGHTVAGGLAEYDRTSGEVRVHHVPAQVYALQRFGGALYAGTTDGAYRLRDAAIERLGVDARPGGGYVARATPVPADAPNRESCARPRKR